MATSNVLGVIANLPQAKTFEEAKAQFAATGEIDGAASTSSVDRLRMVIEWSIPMGKRPALITAEPQVGEMYDGLQQVRKEKSKINYKVATDSTKSKSRSKQINKYLSGFKMASHLKQDAVRVFDDTMKVILGTSEVDGASGDGSVNGVGGRVFNGVLTVIGKQNAADREGKPFTLPEIKSILKPKAKAPTTAVKALQSIKRAIESALTPAADAEKISFRQDTRNALRLIAGETLPNLIKAEQEKAAK